MSSQSGDILQEDLILARGTCGGDVLDALLLLVLLPKMLGELVRVEEGVAAQVTDEESPLVALDQVGPHLEAELELLSTLLTLGLGNLFILLLWIVMGH